MTKGPPLDSNFQNRMLTGDLDSNLLKSLREHADDIDLLLVDLTDERLGVHKLPDNSFVTSSVELSRSEWLNAVSPKPGRIEIGTERHTSFWENAALKFYNYLENLGLSEKTLVINTPWAATSVEGTEVPVFRGISARDMSLKIANLSQILSRTGLEVIDMPERLAVTTRQHQWGIAQYHYSAGAYEWIGKEIQQRLNKS
ncbi:hypothetical protein CQ011_03350 [Arthrobacter sp. MYb213]|nr:hypothetical protein CQ011_03350 [Arthrobacter sp. MYb213]